MFFLNRSDIIVNGKFKQLFIFQQFKGVRIMNIYMLAIIARIKIGI